MAIEEDLAVARRERGGTSASVFGAELEGFLLSQEVHAYVPAAQEIVAALRARASVARSSGMLELERDCIARSRDAHNYGIAFGIARHRASALNLVDLPRTRSRLDMTVLAFALLSSGPPLVAARGPLVPASLIRMGTWLPEDMTAKGLPLPDEVESKLSDDVARARRRRCGPRLRGCYDTEAEAISAAERSMSTVLPYLNRPSNIVGSYRVLCDKLGADGARSVINKNPNVLSCNPIELARVLGRVDHLGRRPRRPRREPADPAGGAQQPGQDCVSAVRRAGLPADTSVRRADVRLN